MDGCDAFAAAREESVCEVLLAGLSCRHRRGRCMGLRVVGSGKQCSKLMIHSLIVRALTAAHSSMGCRPWEINSGDESWRTSRERIAGGGEDG